VACQLSIWAVALEVKSWRNSGKERRHQTMKGGGFVGAAWLV
jgi:hypothetical protein